MRRSILTSVTVVVSLLTSLLVSNAFAFEIDSRCEIFKRKIACTCVILNGGWIVTGRNGDPHWRPALYKSPNQKSIRNPGYDQCYAENGGDQEGARFINTKDK